MTKIRLLQDKLRQERNIKRTLPVREHNGLVFTEVEGVTVTIGIGKSTYLPSEHTGRGARSSAVCRDTDATSTSCV